jgi:hypothetical protein
MSLSLLVFQSGCLWADQLVAFADIRVRLFRRMADLWGDRHLQRVRPPFAPAPGRETSFHGVLQPRRRRLGPVMQIRPTP